MTFRHLDAFPRRPTNGDRILRLFRQYVILTVLQGQYALEQTFILRRDAITRPGKSLLAILERLADHSVTTAT